MIVVDTGPLYAAADTSDAHHTACAAVFQNPPDRLVVPVSVVVEASFLIERHLGPAAEATFLGSLAPSGLSVEQLGEEDLARMAELVATYADLPLGAVDPPSSRSPKSSKRPLCSASTGAISASSGHATRPRSRFCRDYNDADSLSSG